MNLGNVNQHFIIPKKGSNFEPFFHILYALFFVLYALVEVLCAFILPQDPQNLSTSHAHKSATIVTRKNKPS
jgi:hypothetical protein